MWSTEYGPRDHVLVLESKNLSDKVEIRMRIVNKPRSSPYLDVCVCGGGLSWVSQVGLVSQRPTKGRERSEPQGEKREGSICNLEGAAN